MIVRSGAHDLVLEKIARDQTETLSLQTTFNNCDIVIFQSQFNWMAAYGAKLAHNCTISPHCLGMLIYDNNNEKKSPNQICIPSLPRIWTAPVNYSCLNTPHVSQYVHMSFVCFLFEKFQSFRNWNKFGWNTEMEWRGGGIGGALQLNALPF